MINLQIKKKLNSNKMTLDINTKIKMQDFISLYGESGSGKTTFLRILAGLDRSDSTIEVDGEVWQNDNFFMPIQKRKIGFMFQDYSLFTNMSIEQNLLFVKNDKSLSEKMLQMMNLQDLKHRLPYTLSGGQKQRVALARSMMNKPKILLLDEPLSSLDLSMRIKLQEEIKTIHTEFELTTIMVSHEPSEIYKLANRVLEIEDGKIIRDGTPRDILLNSSVSRGFSLRGELLEIKKIDVLFVAIVSVGQELFEIAITSSEAKSLKISQSVELRTKSFSPIIIQK